MEEQQITRLSQEQYNQEKAKKTKSQILFMILLTLLVMLFYIMNIN